MILSTCSVITRPMKKIELEVSYPIVVSHDVSSRITIKTFADTASARPKVYKSGHTQTSQSTQILYYHESKKAALEETLPLLDEEDVDHSVNVDEKSIQAQYKWKRRIPASKFGVIINAKDKSKDQDFVDKIFSLAGKLKVEIIHVIRLFFQIMKKQMLHHMENNMKKMLYRNLSKYLV